MKKLKPTATKAILFLNGTQHEEVFSSRSEAVLWAMSQAGLKPHCGHAMILYQHGYTNLPKNVGYVKLSAI